MSGLCFCARAFSSCGEQGPLFIAVRGPLTVAASLVAEHRLQMRRLSSCGSWTQLLRGMWDLPRPGLEPVSPVLAGRFSTTAPPGKASFTVLKLLCSPAIYPLSLQSLENTDLFIVTIVLPFPECCIVGIIQYVAFSDCLLLLINKYLKFLHVFSWLDSLFLFSPE